MFTWQTRLDQILGPIPVLPVVVIDDLGTAVSLAQALAAGGLTRVEITLRTPAALAAIRLIAQEVPEVIVGAGTVLTPAQVDAAHQAGAQFLVSPGSTPSLLRHLEGCPLPSIPGGVTPSEVMALAEAGFQVIKFFPAEAYGGVATLKALAGPLPHLKFCPTGGISLARAVDYLALPTVPCVGGSWMLPAELIQRGEWAQITTLARQATQLRPPPR